MADQQVKVILNGEDKTGAAFKSASGSVRGFEKDLGSMAKTVGVGVAAIGGLVVAAGINLAKGAAEAEAAIARVDSTLEAMGASAMRNRDAIFQAADAAVKLGFDDEAAAESIAKFYQRTNDLTEAINLNNVAMDLARAKNIDLSSAANLVGQVLAGNGRVLKQYGIDLDETKTPLEALGELHNQVRGNAENFAQTFQGQMSILNESVSNLKDTIGVALIEAIQPFVTDLAKWAQNPDVQKKIKEIATLLGEWVSITIPVVIESLRILYSWFKNITDILGEIIFRVTQAIEAVQRFIEAAKGISTSVVNRIGGVFGGGRASGGPVSMGQTYLVGEQGPELFTPSTSGSIIPNGALMAGGGGTVVNIYNPVLLDESMIDRMGQQVVRALGRSLRI